VGDKHENAIREELSKYNNLEFVRQEKALGTGDAVKQLEPILKDKKDAHLLVLPGDAPLLREETIRELYRYHFEKNANITVLTAELEDPTGYGRIVRMDREPEKIKYIVEEKDAFPEEKEIREVNSGVYIFKIGPLFEHLKSLRPQNEQQEYYLTDIIQIVQRKEGGVFAVKARDWREILGVNTREQHEQAIKIMKQRLIDKWTASGVTFIDPENVYIEVEVEIGKDAIIYPFVSLMGKTKIGEDAVIGPGAKLKDKVIPKGKKVGI
jgi:bifunctional UDP-N-acetylglucosamine pyrophosphorylase/glucosamine-1-phosphate N-acetyltransferase